MINKVHIPIDTVVHHDMMYTQAPNNLWHLPRETWDKIWNNVTGKTINVAILDTGYASHPDLPVPSKERSFVGQPIQDGNGHGTHCAGTATGRNGLGVAPEANLFVGKVLSNAGSGSSAGIAAGIRWAIDEGADVISLSLGGGGPDEATRRAGEHALSKGVVLVAAAGNAGYNGGNTIGYPAKF